MPQSHAARRAYSTLEVSHVCQVDPATVARWCDLGRITCFRTPGGHRRILESDLIHFLQTHGMPMPESLRPARPRVLGIGLRAAFARMVRALGTKLSTSLDIEVEEDEVTGLLRIGAERPSWVLIGRDCDAPAELLERIRKNPATRPIRLAVLGMEPASAAGRRMRRAGAEECLPDSASIKEFFGRLADLR